MAKKNAVKKSRKKAKPVKATPREIFLDIAVNEIVISGVDAVMFWDMFREAIIGQVPEVDGADWPAITFDRHGDDGVIVRQSLLISGERL